MQNQMFEKEKFIQEIKDNVKNLYRKTLEEASQQEVYQAVSQAEIGRASCRERV